MPPTSAASASARSAVPSGLPSSTTSTSIMSVAEARIRRSTSAMVADSLYVGSTTRVFMCGPRYSGGLTARPHRARRYDADVDQPLPAPLPNNPDDHPYTASRGALIGAFLAVVVAG